jgi:succinate dehydrogenase / fumarate reductase membrane anchor subunit
MGDGTELGRVRGLGPAREGEEGWLQQRYTAVGNLLLVSFFAISLVLLPDLGFATVSGWLKHPVPAITLALLVMNVFWHARLGLREMIGDYVHDEGNKFAVFLLIDFAAAGGVAFGLFSILRLALGVATGAAA